MESVVGSSPTWGTNFYYGDVMSILSWDKPKKLRTNEQHATMYASDGGPPGTYVPNMSDEDMEKWKAKLTGTRRGVPQVEIRKSFSNQMLIIVSLGGYSYKYYTPENTKDKNIHISLNGPLQMTFEDMQEMNAAIEEAKQFLQNLK